MPLFPLFPYLKDINRISLTFRSSHLEKEYFAYYLPKNFSQAKLQLFFLIILMITTFLIESNFISDLLMSCFIKIISFLAVFALFYLIMLKIKNLVALWMSIINLLMLSCFFYQLKMLEVIYENNPTNLQMYRMLLTFCFVSYYQKTAFRVSWIMKSIELIITFIFLIFAFDKIFFDGMFFVLIILLCFAMVNGYFYEKYFKETYLEMQEYTSLVEKYRYLLKEVDPGVNILLKQTKKEMNSHKKKLFSKKKEFHSLKSIDKITYEIEYINSWAQEKHSLNSLEKVMSFFDEMYFKDSKETRKKTPEKVKTIKNYLEYLHSLNDSRSSIDFFPANSYFCYKKQGTNPNSQQKHHLYLAIFCVYEWKSDIYVLVRLNDFDWEKEVEELKELDRFKDQLLANITHDLRTPLNGMIYFIKQAKESRKDEVELKKLLKYAEINGNLLMNLIGDILDFSLLKANKMRLNVKKFCLKSVLDEVLVLLQSKAEFQAIKLILLFLCKDDMVIESDSDRLKQVLINLLSNAIKFTRKGFVKVRVYKTREQLVKFEVIDTGIGISQETIQKLGTPFNTFNPQGLNGKGIGLGLVISKEIIGKLGPKPELFISSRVGSGSKFAFMIYRSLFLKENVAVQRSKVNIFPLSRNKEFTFEKLVLHNQFNDMLSKECEYSEEIIINNGKEKDDRFSEIDSMDLKLESHISMNFPTEEINEKPAYQEEESKDVSPISIKEFFHQPLKKQTMIMLNRKDGFRTMKNHQQTPIKKLIPVLNERKKTLKILIVDDNLFNILIMEKFLNKLNEKREKPLVCHEFAHNGEIAVEKFKENNANLSENPFDIIVMDCEMPIMNGFDASREITRLINEEKLKKCTIVAYSALNVDSEIKKCKENGMKYFLYKPCNEHELFDTLLKCLTLGEEDGTSARSTKKFSV